MRVVRFHHRDQFTKGAFKCEYGKHAYGDYGDYFHRINCDLGNRLPVPPRELPIGLCAFTKLGLEVFEFHMRAAAALREPDIVASDVEVDEADVIYSDPYQVVFKWTDHPVNSSVYLSPTLSTRSSPQCKPETTPAVPL